MAQVAVYSTVQYSTVYPTIMAVVAVLQMNMERAVVTSMKAASSRLRPVPATSSTRRARRRWIPTF